MAVVVLLGQPQSAFTDVYRLTAQVEWEICNTTNCEYIRSLFPDEGLTFELFVEIDPDAEPRWVNPVPPAGLTCTYDAPPLSLTSSNVQNATTMYSPMGSGVTVADDVPYDQIGMWWELTDDPCPNENPCLRVLEGDELWSLVVYFEYDPTGSSLDGCQLTVPIDMSQFMGVYFAVLGDDTQECVWAHVLAVQRWEPSDMLTALVDAVMSLNLNSGISNSLDAKLESAVAALDDVNEQNDVSACNRIQAFINAVEAQRGTQISDAEADALIAAAQEIITTLGCQ